MTANSEMPPVPQDLTALYKAVGALSVEFGHTKGAYAWDRYAVMPMYTLPGSVAGRFPPGLEDCSENYLLHTSYVEMPSLLGRRGALVAHAGFRRYTPPTDPAGRGFRTNEWALGYTMSGKDLNSLEIGVALSGARRYSQPPTPALGSVGRKLSKARGREAWRADQLADGRSTSLRMPRGFITPLLNRGEMHDVTAVVVQVHEFSNASDLAEHSADVPRASTAVRLLWGCDE
jgi:hypothetical protein